MTPHTQEYSVIPLTRGCVAVVDSELYEDLNRFSWSAVWDPDTKSFRASCAMKQADGSFKSVIMARYITGAKEDEIVDHGNHCTLDNRRENLRRAADGQNAWNARLSSANTSGFKGVSWNGDKWRARILFGGQRISIGVFSSKEEAARAYDEAARRLFGEFAMTNVDLGLLAENHISPG